MLTFRAGFLSCRSLLQCAFVVPFMIALTWGGVAYDWSRSVSKHCYIPDRLSDKVRLPSPSTVRTFWELSWLGWSGLHLSWLVCPPSIKILFSRRNISS